MIESLTNIMDAKKRFPDLPHDHVQHLCYISYLIFNGTTWDKVVQRRNLTYLELGMLLMILDADEIKELQTQAEQNWDDYVEREKQDREQERKYKLLVWALGSPSVWPEVDPNTLVGVNTTIAIQVNGKLCGTVEAPNDALEQTVEQLAYQNDRIKAHIEGKHITRKVFVEGRVLNFVVQDGMG